MKKSNRENPPCQYSADFPGLIELVADKDGRPAFLVKEEGKPKVVTEWERDGIIFIPPPIGQIRWALPRVGEVKGYYQELKTRGVKKFLQEVVDELEEYFRKYWEAPEEIHYLYSALWVGHTYFIECFNYSPFDYVYGPPERGKSRKGESMLYASRRGVKITTIKPQHIIRLADDTSATLFVDTNNLSAQLKCQEVKDVILNRFERGLSVMRVHRPGKGRFREMDYYDVFGPTLIATNDLVEWVVESRGIAIQMTLSSERYPKPTPEDGLPFREKLTAVRAYFMVRGLKLPSVSLPGGGRLVDILNPLYSIATHVGLDKEFLEFYNMQVEERKRARAFTPEAGVLKAISAYKEQKRVPLKELTHAYNRLSESTWSITEREMARKLRSLGFMVKPGHSNRGIVCLNGTLEDMLQEYGIRGG